MKTFVKTLFAASFLVAATAQAVTLKVNDDAAAGLAEFNGFLGTTVASEDFNGLGATQVIGSGDHSSWENKAASFDTDVGVFTLDSFGNGGLNVYREELMIESEATGEYGRQSLPKAAGDFWLDSNDARQVTWDFTKPAGGHFNTLGFELADASDVSADLTLLFSDGTSETITFPEANGNLKFVSIYSKTNILGGSLIFDNSSGNDGWGIDNVTLGTLPEPGTLLLMGLGLLGLGAARRRTSK